MVTTHYVCAEGCYLAALGSLAAMWGGSVWIEPEELVASTVYRWQKLFRS